MPLAKGPKSNSFKGKLIQKLSSKTISRKKEHIFDIFVSETRNKEYVSWFLPAAKPLVLERQVLLLGWGDRKKSSLQDSINPSLQILFRVGSVAPSPDFSSGGWDQLLSNKLFVELILC